MLYELRSYWIEPSQLDAYLAWADTKALPVLQGECGFRLVGFWRVEGADGTDDDPPNVTWLLAWRDRAEREERWAMARSSASWAKINEDRPKFHRRPGAIRFLVGTPRSPFQ